MIRIGIDVHGVLDTAPHFFSELSRLLVENGHEVHILTGAEKTSELENYLKETLGLSWTHFFSVTSFHKKIGTEITYIQGNPYMDNKIWNHSKSEYCKKHNIQLHIDDSDIYGKYFTTPYARFQNSMPESCEDKGLKIDYRNMETTGEIHHDFMEEELKDDLSNYDDSMYKKPSVTVDVAICTIIKNDLKILLIKRKYPPDRGSWAIPGGFLDIELKESLEQAAARELEEETGLKNLFIEQLKTYGDVDRDPRTRIITTAYFSLIPYSSLKGQTIMSASDAADAKWFSLNDYQSEMAEENENLAFDHDLILSDLKQRLREKIAYTAIAFELLQDEFTWTDLRKVYETILNKKIDPTNFKKKIRALYNIREMKPKKTGNSAGRPPALLNFIGEKEYYI